VAQAEKGDIAGAIADCAMAAGADLVVVGTRGRSNLAGTVLGSVSHRLIHLAHCPVLVVGAQAAPHPAERHLPVGAATA
jgi:nucleotide-binding universal stress UspA family protein